MCVGAGAVLEGDVAKILFTACLPNEEPAPNMNPSANDCVIFGLLMIFIVLVFDFNGGGGVLLFCVINSTIVYNIDLYTMNLLFPFI